MRDVAAEAGLNIATIHYHVESKAQLIRLVVTHAHERFAAHAVPPSGHTATGAIRAHLNAAFGVLEDDPQLACVLAEVGVEAAHDRSVAEIVAEAEQRWRAALQRILVDLPAHRRRQVSALIMLALKGACLQPTDGKGLRDARRALIASIEAVVAQGGGV